jgi:hypothetical protein
MSGITVEIYKKIELANQNILVTYDESSEEVEIKLERKLKNGTIIGTDYFSIHTSYISPLVSMLNELKAAIE